jgi:membrane-associated protease RseP (regulator of RpoE activity)
MTFLQHVGSFFKTILADGIKVSGAVEPVVDLAFPGIAVLYNSTVQAVSVAEAAGEAAAGSSTGNGAAKLAAVTSAIEPLAVAYLKSQGITASSMQVQAWVNAVVATLNALPAPHPVKEGLFAGTPAPATAKAA